ncbi:MAG: hypothetical protein U0172_09070 [Nitrospiraceae bacterium]
MSASRQTFDRPTPLPTAPQQLLADYSLSQRLRSTYHDLWQTLTERLRWSRGVVRETPAGRLPALSESQQRTIARLSERYAIRFEQELSEATALRCYEYLDLLDRSLAPLADVLPDKPTLHDVGSANGWYTSMLDAFWKPSRMTLVEADGYRLYADGHSRWDAAQGYVETRPHVEYCVADYCAVEQSAQVITAFYPFVTPEPVLAWRLPLRWLVPQALFSRIAHNLSADGWFVMMNHGPDEAAVASSICESVGLRSVCRTPVTELLRARTRAPVVSCWRRAGAVHPR